MPIMECSEAERLPLGRGSASEPWLSAKRFDTCHGHDNLPMYCEDAMHGCQYNCDSTVCMQAVLCVSVFLSPVVRAFYAEQRKVIPVFFLLLL